MRFLLTAVVLAAAASAAHVANVSTITYKTCPAARSSAYSAKGSMAPAAPPSAYSAKGSMAPAAPPSAYSAKGTMAPAATKGIQQMSAETQGAEMPGTSTITYKASCPASSAPAPMQSAMGSMAPPSYSMEPQPQSSTAPATAHCPTTLTEGSYQYPHLIIPISSTAPTTAYGTQYNASITPTTSSIFNFDIPSSYTGTCSLIFLFPLQSQLSTSSYSFSGDGQVNIALLDGVVDAGTTYDSAPGKKIDYGVSKLMPGTETVVFTRPCPSGKTVSFELKAVGGTKLEYFQDFNPSPIGLYFTTC